MNPKHKSNIVILMSIITFLLVIGISLSVITNMKINAGDSNVRSDKDLVCFFTVDQTTNVNITWYKNSVLNLTASINCTSGVECFTSLGLGTVPNLYTVKNDMWNCTIGYYNGSAVQNGEVHVTIDDTPPTTPRIFNSGSEIINVTVPIVEDVGLTLVVNSTDDDNDTITYTINDTTFCSIGSSSGVLVCSPTSESHLGVRMLRLTASADLSSTGKILTINVTPTNDAPTFSPSLYAFNITEGQVFNYYVNGADDEYNVPLVLQIYNVTPYLNLTVTQINETAFVIMLGNNRTATFSEGLVNYNVTLLLNDTDNVTYNNRSIRTSFNVTGITFNHLPNISYAFFNTTTMRQGGNLSIYINASDIDNNTLTFSSNNVRYNITSSSGTLYGVVTNASFIYAWINITNLTNDDVTHTNVTIYVFDTNQNNNQTITFFINNTNDVPVIYEASNSSSNSYNITNLSELVAYTGVAFTYQINASDIDSITYDSASTGIGTYSTNDSTFAIGSTTGLLSFTPNASGNHSFIVTVTDNGGLTYNYTASIAISINNAPTVTVDPIVVQCYEYDSSNWPNRCYYNISENATESDVGDYIASYYTNSSFFTINSSTGIINFTANQSMVGNNSVLLNITDSRGGITSVIMYLVINNTNNAPTLSAPSLPSGNMIVGTPYQIIYNASDLDLQLGTYENLTFSGSSSGANTTIFSLSKLSNTQVELLITPISASYEGNYSINITVTDAIGNTSSYYTSIYIYNATSSPTILTVRPSGAPLNDTVDNITWINVTNFPTFNTTINIYEDTNYTFNQTSVADNSSYSNFLNYTWYYDESSVSTAGYYRKSFNFFSNGTHNVTFVATDQYNSAVSFTWMVNVINVNRPPTYNNLSLENLTLSGSGFIPNYLTYSSSTRRFYDPDDDEAALGYSMDNTTSLVFSSTSCSHATFSFEQNRLNVVATSTGACYIIFNATDVVDSTLSVASQVVFINITNISQSSTTTVTVTRQTSGGSSSTPITIPIPLEVEKPKPLNILTPKLVTMYKNATIQIPIVINNTWNDTLIGITLEATTNASNVTMYLDDIFIPKLNSGESYETTLYVRNYKSEGHYEIQIAANVSIPEYRDTAQIFINSAEMNSEGDELDSKISFAQDLLSSNPECQELNELLQQAKTALGEQKYAEGAKVIDNVLNGCKFLVANSKNKEMPDRNFVKTFEWKRSYNDYLILGLFGILFCITLFYILKKDDPQQIF